jgi:hypothetical protein
MRFLLLLAVIAGCGKHTIQETSSPVEGLRAKRDAALSHYSEAMDGSGFVGDHCDALLFSSLGAIGGYPVDIVKAEYAPGKWERHPDKDCFPANSAARLSKDMALGMISWAYFTGRLDVLKRFYDQAKSDNWIICDAEDSVVLLSRCLLSVNLIRLMQKILGEPLFAANWFWPGPFDPREESTNLLAEGFEAHLLMWRLYVTAKVDGSVDNSDLSTMKSYCEAKPKNALFCAISHKFSDGDQTQAVDLLIHETPFPSGRLPNSSDRCEPYLWQREQGDDWQPCPQENKVHDNVDFLIAAWVVLEG